MKLVKFYDGTYGVRTTYSYRHKCWYYKDLKTEIRLEWTKKSRYFPNCKGTREEALKVVNEPSVSYEYDDEHEVI